MAFCRVNTGVKLVWITGVRFDTGVTLTCLSDRAGFTRVRTNIFFYWYFSH